VLSVVATGDFIDRPWYKENVESRAKFPPNHMIKEKEGVVTRLAPESSFLRLGHLELAWRREETENMVKMVKFGVATTSSMKHLEKLSGDELILAFYKKTVEVQIELVVNWIRVGFVEGNMNNDNLSVGGFTLDLGPFAFMEKYKHSFQPFTSDGSGHYNFLNQPQAISTALSVFGAALSSALVEEESKKEMQTIISTHFKDIFTRKYKNMRMKKLGLVDWRGKSDDDLWWKLIDGMDGSQAGVDYTCFFAGLSR